MAKDIALIFIIFFSISGICFYKWNMIHTRIKQMDLILCATISHKIAVIDMYPELKNKVYTMKEYV